MFRPADFTGIRTYVAARDGSDVAALVLRRRLFRLYVPTPRLTVVFVTPSLLVTRPAWFVWIRERPPSSGERTIVVGDDLQASKRTPVRTTNAPGIPLSDECRQRRGTGPPKLSLTVAPARVGWNGWADSHGSKTSSWSTTSIPWYWRSNLRRRRFGALDACYEYGSAPKSPRHTTPY